MPLETLLKVVEGAPFWAVLASHFSLTKPLGIYHVSILMQTVYTAILTVVALAWNLISTKSIESTIEFGWRGLLGPLALGVFHIYMLIDGGKNNSIIPNMVNGFNAIVGTLGSVTYFTFYFMGILKNSDLFVGVSYLWSSLSSIYYLAAV